MDKIKNQSGLYETRLSQKEQDVIWNEISKNISPIGKYALFTPQDNLEYFIISEIELKYNSYKATIKANNKVFDVFYNICITEHSVNRSIVLLLFH